MTHSPRSPSPQDWSGVIFVLLGSVMLSAKGVYAKLLYQEGLDFITVMAVRGVLALPFFLFWAWFNSGLAPLFKADWKTLYVTVLVGLLCFYAGGAMDFYALTLIDANLERVILYTYPAMIVIALAVRRGQWPGVNVVLGLVLTSVGIMLAIGGLDADLWRANKVGALLVLACAVTYACYFFANEYAGSRLGSRAFVFLVTTTATLAIGIHFLAVHDLADIHISARAWNLFGMFTVTSTVAPVLLLAEGVKRIGAQRGGLLSTVGPPSTVAFSAVFLGESLLWFQFLGIVAVLAGILVLERRTVAPPPVSD